MDMLYVTQIKGENFKHFFANHSHTLKQRKVWLVLLFLIVNTFNLHAEGLLEIAPSEEDDVALYIGVGEDDGANYGNFAWKDSPSRLFFHVLDYNSEKVYMGFSAPLNRRNFNIGRKELKFMYRVVAPDGTPCMDWQSLGMGNISTRTEAINGPKMLGNPLGYIPIIFDPSDYQQNGNYYIEFYKEDRRPRDLAFYMRYFDITVSTMGGTQPVTGRVWSNNWALALNDDGPCRNTGNNEDTFCRSFNGSFYVCSNEGYVTKIDFNNDSTFHGFRAGNFNVSFNQFGTDKTGDILEDRKSLFGERINFDVLVDDFLPVFLNDPDINICPTGTFGRFQAHPDFLTQCRREGYCINVSASQIGQFEVIIDLNSNNRYDGFPERILAYQLQPSDLSTNPADPNFPFEACIEWDGKDDEGNVLDHTNFSLFITYSQGAYHFPVFDVELNQDGFIVSNVRPADPKPVPIFWSDGYIPFSNGTGDLIEEFNGCFPEFNSDSSTVTARCHRWEVFNYGNKNTINNWWFASRDAKSFRNVVLPRLTITCPPDIIVSCLEDISPDDLGLPEVTGGCNLIGVTFSDERIDTNCPGSYTILRTWVAEDEGVEPASCLQTISVEDKIEPMILAYPVDTTLSCGESLPWPEIPATDECTPDSLLVLDSTETFSGGGLPNDPLIITRTWTVSDLCGNEASVSQQIRIDDCEDDCDIESLVPYHPQCEDDGNYILQLEVRGTGLRFDENNFKVIVDHRPRTVLSKSINSDRTRAYLEVEVVGDGTPDIEIFVQMASQCSHTLRHAYDEPDCGGYDCRIGRPLGTGDSLWIYPNPSNGLINVILNTEMDGSGDDDAEILVLDQVGKIVKKISVVENHRADLDLTNLPSGLYFVKPSGEYAVKAKRILLRR